MNENEKAKFNSITTQSYFHDQAASSRVFQSIMEKLRKNQKGVKVYSFLAFPVNFFPQVTYN